MGYPTSIIPHGHVNIQECSRLTDSTPSKLRVWERRYRYPSPIRGHKGHRFYPEHMLDDIRRIVDARKRGVPMENLIRDGYPVCATVKTSPTRREVLRGPLGELEVPDDVISRMLQRRLVDALMDGDWAIIRECQHAASTIHPLHRELAVYRPLSVASVALAKAGIE